jgi:alkylation response protein AidB-like acyl-CoA dehydrogenase
MRWVTARQTGDDVQPMEFQFSENEEQFRSEIRRFVKVNLPYKHFAHKYAEEADDADWEFAMSISKKLAQKKWLTISWPKEFGGMGSSLWEEAVFREEVGYWGIPGTTMGIGGTIWVGPSLMRFGTKEQQKKYLPLIASGEPDGIWCTGYSEPDAGSDLASLQTRAIRSGDEYIVNGQKVWTSCAHRARWCWLACRTNPGAPKKYQGLSLLIVDMKSPGVIVRPIRNLVGAHIFNEVFFNDVRVPVENLVGEENNGWKRLMQALAFERSLAINYSGLHRRFLEELVLYAKKTNQIKKPEIRQKLADLAIDVQILKLFAYETIWKIDRGMKITYEPSRDKAYSDGLHEKLSRIGTEILGAFAQLDPLHKNSRWTKLGGAIEHLYWVAPGISTAAGTTNTQRNIVGQFGLHLPRAY